MDHKIFKILLAQRGLVQYELARELGWCFSKLSQIVNAYREIRPDEIEAICKALKVKPAKLFPELANGKSKSQARRRHVRRESCTDVVA